MSEKTSRVEYAFAKGPLPGIDKLTTDAAREIAARPQFKGGIGNHVYVNGFDLERIEAEAFEHGKRSRPSRGNAVRAVDTLDEAVRKR